MTTLRSIEEGPYKVAVTITDVDNARNSTTARSTANVSNAAPVALLLWSAECS